VADGQRGESVTRQPPAPSVDRLGLHHHPRNNRLYFRSTRQASTTVCRADCRGLPMQSPALAMYLCTDRALTLTLAVSYGGARRSVMWGFGGV
jgi:hypothetical protein